MKEERFYGRPGLNVETYDALHELHARAGNITALMGDVDFYRSHAARAGGAVLELGCGTGRLVWPIAEAGVEITGVDRSDAMLDRARSKTTEYADEVGRRVSFQRANMKGFDLGKTFALVFIAFRSFQCLLTSDEERRSLLTIHKHLRPGGLLIINNFDPRLDYLIPGAAPPAVMPDNLRHPASGNRVTVEISSREIDLLRQLIVEKWRFREIDDSEAVLREEEETLRLRWIYRQEMRYLLELCGFDVEAEYSDFRGNPPEYGKEQIFLARKRR
jgi:SAM-dependent methyltransferase